LAIALPLAVQAGEAHVLDVRATRAPDETWRFDVTVRHDDEGWDHCADKWQLVTPDGTVLGERILLHPHEMEQPFTRSLSGITVPPHVVRVIVRAHDKLHGWGGQELAVDLPYARGS
jgi:hypothetical protein